MEKRQMVKICDIGNPNLVDVLEKGGRGGGGSFIIVGAGY